MVGVIVLRGSEEGAQVGGCKHLGSKEADLLKLMKLCASTLIFHKRCDCVSVTGACLPVAQVMAEIKEIEAEVLSITQAKPPISKAKIDSIVALALKHHRVRAYFFPSITKCELTPCN